MDFSNALKAVIKGKSVRRSSWKIDWKLCLLKDKLALVSKKQDLICELVNGEEGDCLESDDLLANDWIYVK